MTIQYVYEKILLETLKNPENLKNEIIKVWNYKNFDVKIELTYDTIKNEYGNNAFGFFDSNENIIKISCTELINFIGIKICTNNIQELDQNICKNIFNYYVLYIVAHEIHHAYMFNILNEEYIELKNKDNTLEYINKSLEKYADEYALKYLETHGILAENIGRLAIELREGKYRIFKNKYETNEECKSRYISEKIENLKKLVYDN